ncbi:MAG TPA: hypothetical protein VI072_22690 [Polyangiaceae bacterium]
MLAGDETELPDATFFTIAPDFACEVPSKSTEKLDLAGSALPSRHDAPGYLFSNRCSRAADRVGMQASLCIAALVAVSPTVVGCATRSLPPPAAPAKESFTEPIQSSPTAAAMSIGTARA